MTSKHLFEERITIWKATSFDAAIALAEREAKSYAREGECKYLGLAQAYWMFAGSLKSGAEVFSLMRESDYAQKRYLCAFFDTGKERQLNGDGT